MGFLIKKQSSRKGEVYGGDRIEESVGGREWFPAKNGGID